MRSRHNCHVGMPFCKEEAKGERILSDGILLSAAASIWGSWLTRFQLVAKKKFRSFFFQSISRPTRTLAIEETEERVLYRILYNVVLSLSLSINNANWWIWSAKDFSRVTFAIYFRVGARQASHATQHKKKRAIYHDCNANCVIVTMNNCWSGVSLKIEFDWHLEMYNYSIAMSSTYIIILNFSQLDESFKSHMSSRSKVN